MEQRRNTICVTQTILYWSWRWLGFSLDYCGKAAISRMLKNALDMPAASCENSFEFGTG